MIKILLNNEEKQIIFKSYTEVKNYLKTTDGAIREAEDNGRALKNPETGEKFWIDKLFCEEEP